jgi:hypothetical protein
MLTTKLEASRYYMIGRHLDFGVKLEIINNIYHVSYYKNKEINNFNNIVEVVYLNNSNDYVYDIETEDDIINAYNDLELVDAIQSILNRLRRKDDENV